MDTADYSQFSDKPAPTEEASKKLNDLVTTVREKEQEIAAHGKALAKAQEELRKLLRESIPEQMKAMGMTDCKTTSGLQVEIKDEVEASISEDRQAAAHKWLEENGNAGLIKRVLLVMFNRDQVEEATKLLKELQGRYAAVTTKETVHPSTLKAFVKGERKEGRDVPHELFGIYEWTTAKIREVKAK